MVGINTVNKNLTCIVKIRFESKIGRHTIGYLRFNDSEQTHLSKVYTTMSVRCPQPASITLKHLFFNGPDQ